MNIVQIGVNDGKDHVLEYIKTNVNNINSLFLVDANPKCLDVAKTQYTFIENVNYVNLAISLDGDDKKQFFIPFGSETHAHASLNIDHIHKHGHINYDTIIVECKSINNFLNFLNKNIDRLYIDTEGLDISIIDSLDFNIFKIPYIEFEYIHSDGTLSFGGPKLDKLKLKLSEFGYSLRTEQYNIIAELNK
jgi:hypothetical protein